MRQPRFQISLVVIGGPLLSSLCMAGLPVNQSGLGPLQFGMTRKQAQKAVPRATFKDITDWEGDEYTELRLNGKALAQLYFTSIETGEAKLTDMRIVAASCATGEGIHPGSTIREAIRVWGPIKATSLNGENGATYLDFERSPSWLTIVKSAEKEEIAYFVLGQMARTSHSK